MEQGIGMLGQNGWEIAIGANSYHWNLTMVTLIIYIPIIYTMYSAMTLVKLMGIDYIGMYAFIYL